MFPIPSQTSGDNKFAGFSLQSNLSFKGETSLKFIENSQVLSSDGGNANSIGYNNGGKNLFSVNLAPKYVSASNIVRNSANNTLSILNAEKVKENATKVSNWSPYTKQINNVNYLNIYGQMQVYPGPASTLPPLLRVHSKSPTNTFG